MAEKGSQISDEHLLVSLETFCNMSIPPDVLKSPTPQFLETVFSCLMKDIQLSVDATRQVPFKTATVLEHPEHFEDALPFVTYFSILQQLMEFANVPDFSIKDLTEPKPKRTKKILVFILALWKHILTKYQNYKDIKESLEAENDERLSLQERLLDLEQQYKCIQEMDINSARREELFRLKSASEKQVAEISKQKEALNNEYQNIKTEIADRQNKISELDVGLITQKEKLDDLNNAILKSPLRLSKEIEVLAAKLSEENAKVIDVMKKVKEKKQEVQHVLSKLEVFENLVSEVKDAVVKGEMLRNEATSVNDLQEVLNVKTKEMKKLETVLESTNNEVHVLEQRMIQLQLQNKSKIDGLQQLCNMHGGSIEKEYKILKTEEDMEITLKEEINVISKEIEEVEQQCNNFMKVKDHEQKLIKKLFDEFVEQYDKDASKATDKLQKLLSE